MSDRHIIDRAAFAHVLRALAGDGYRLVGPTVRDGAIDHADITGIDDLPAGYTAMHAAGAYRLARRADDALFGYAVGPRSWKQLLFAPRVQLFQIRRRDHQVIEPPLPAGKLALIGARACDLHAIAIQDRVFLEGLEVDVDYQARRRDLFVVAVQCGEAGGTCFCASMGTGPRAEAGFDLALTELVDTGRFVVEIGSDRGADLLARVASAPADPGEVAAAEAIVATTARSMGRHLDTTGIKELLYGAQEHARWDAVAERCLSCTNCTLACPTCFCASVEDTGSIASPGSAGASTPEERAEWIDGEVAERWRRWDSCFTLDHSYVHGGSVRGSTRARYRQWLTHKLASWIDQFGVSGCVGCGRCITWCPVGIDITEEVAAIRTSPGGAP